MEAPASPATLASRIVMGSMHTGLECHPERFDELGRFYAERAKGGTGLIVTGGFAPNFAGRMKNEPGTFERPDQVAHHRKITAPVRAAGGRILLQILHAGRYGYHPAVVAPSPIKSPINPHTPRELGAMVVREVGRRAVERRTVDLPGERLGADQAQQVAHTGPHQSSVLV